MYGVMLKANTDIFSIDPPVMAVKKLKFSFEKLLIISFIASPFTNGIDVYKRQA